jgi:hypothetical protein
MLIALVAGALSMFISACAAYAYSRFRFRGRRLGLLGLLLIQMFPQFLAIVTLYLMFTIITDYYPRIGFNTPWSLTILYLGGALGANTWLMKGFLDTIPKDLDESARVDGATHAQIFLGIILPLITPHPGRHRPARLHRLRQRVPDRQRLPHRPVVQDPGRRPVGPGRRGAQQQLRDVRGRRGAGRDPDGGAVPDPAAVHRRRADHRSGEGLTVQDSLVTQPHHDGAALHVGTDAPGLGETVPVFLRVPRGPGSWPPSPPVPGPGRRPGRGRGGY